MGYRTSAVVRQKAIRAGSSGWIANVPTVQSTNLRDSSNLPIDLCAAGLRTILFALNAFANVCSKKVRSQHPLQVVTIKYDDVIQTFPSNCANEPLDVSILPWTCWRREDLLNV